MLKYIMILLLAIGASSLVACHSLLSKVRVVDVVQGNVVTSKQLAKLKKGMSKTEVTDLLGEPIYDEAFNDNRLDYVYTSQPAMEKRQTKVLSIYFKHGKVSHFSQNQYVNRD